MSDGGDVSSTPKLRNAKACEACRASKSRCLRSSEKDVCSRCEGSGTPCIIRSKARPMRARNARMSNPSSSSKHLVAVKRDAGFFLDLPPVLAPDTGDTMDELHNHHKRVLGDEDCSVRPKSAEGTRHSVIEPRKLNLQDAERLLAAFRHKAPLFPFVSISDEMTVSSLSRTSPFLLLAILTVASGMDTPLNYQMDQEFRRILGAKVVVEGQKSLDFLQGILIYIAWYPTHARPRNNQVFMYMGLATSLVTELGLDKQMPDENIFQSINTDGLVENGMFTEAARMAYLGSYYLSAALSMGFQKPNYVQYRDLMDNRGMSLLHSDCPEDIFALIKLLHLIERIATVFRSVQKPSFDPNNDMTIQIFVSELQELRGSISPEVRSMPHIAMAEQFANITIFSHELGFLKRPYPSIPSAVFPQSHLTSCLAACKLFFEVLLSIPETMYPHFSNVQYAMIIQAILVLSRLTFLMAATLNWDAGTTRSHIPMVMYLDALCYRFQALSSTPMHTADDEGAKHSDALHIFSLVLGSVKRSYVRRVEGIQPFTSLVDPALAKGPHCPIKDASLSVYFDQDLDSAYDSSSYGGDLGGSSTSPSDVHHSASIGTATPLYHDLWATMTGTWAEEF